MSNNAAANNSAGGIPVVGNRIDDQAYSKTCHQCRRKIQGVAASCKNLRNGRPCVIRFCRLCLSNRYGEEAQQVVLLDDWSCPKCRGKCNCSTCMKIKGTKPSRG